MRSVSVTVAATLCRYINCRNDVIHVVVMYGIAMPGCSNMLAEIPASICVYLMLTNSNLPASELENIASLKNFKLLMPSSVRRSIMLSPPNSGGPCWIAVGVVFDAPSFCNATSENQNISSRPGFGLYLDLIHI